MEGKFKLLAIYVAPSMANWIRNRLKISDKMFDVNSSGKFFKQNFDSKFDSIHGIYVMKNS